MLVVHDVVTRREIVEEALGGLLARPGAPMRTTTTGDVALGQHGELRARKNEAPLERRHGDVPAGSGEIGPTRVEAEVHAVIGQQVMHPFGRPGAVGTDGDAVPVGEQLIDLAHERRTVADDRIPTGGRHGRDIRPFGCGGDGPGRRVGLGEQPVEVDVQLRERRRRRHPRSWPASARGRPPRRGCRRPGRASDADRPAGPTHPCRADRTTPGHRP